MAEITKHYKIEIETDETGESAPSPIPNVKSPSAEDTVTPPTSIKQWLNRNIRSAEIASPWIYGGVEAAKLGWSLVKQGAETTMDAWYALEEDYIGQNNVNNAKAIIGVVSNVGKSAISGVIAGAKIGGVTGNPLLGAAIGMTFGVAGSGIQLALQARATIVDQYRSLENTAYSQYFNSVRFGLINGGRGTEN